MNFLITKQLKDKLRYKILLSIIFTILIGFILPEPITIPVKGATSKDWNKDTFWFEPWGTSGVHKGIDIFAKQDTPVIATTNLLLIYRGELKKGGNVILGLGPKWRLHYFAHLSSIDKQAGLILRHGEQIGQVGDTGNAFGKQPHLHYSIISLIPLPWRIDNASQGYKKAFFLDPIEYFKNQ